MIVSDIAEYFQGAGFTALTYDTRCLGQSDGQPRNDINPSRNVEDYHDALTFLKRHPLVDPTKIAYWGYSFSGMVALVAAALDKRAQAVVAMCPLTIWEFPEDKWARVLARSMRDRESRVAGNNPLYIPMLTEDGENPAGFGAGFQPDDFKLIAGAKELLPDLVELPTTLSTYYHVAAFNPFALIPRVSPTPAMIVVAEKDIVSPAKLQKTLVYDALKEPKNLLVVPGKGHLNVLSGDNFDQVLGAQVTYLREVLRV